MNVEVVLDSNIFFRILISKGNILDILFDDNLKIFSPLKLKEEFFRNQTEILLKSELSVKEFNELSLLIFKKINFVSSQEYKIFISEAKRLLKGHEKDEDFVALCLSKKIRLWAYEKRIFEIGLGISTKQLAEKIKAF